HRDVRGCARGGLARHDSRTSAHRRCRGVTTCGQARQPIREESVRRRRLGFWRWIAVILIKPIMLLFTRRTWRGLEHVPTTGPAILVSNHISHADPLVVA